jgi:mRNA interferase MazF
VAGFVKGDVVVLPFPFSDLSNAKRRPAVVLVQLQGDDVILAQITSQTVSDIYSIPLKDSDFSYGKLNKLSNIRPNRIFTADAAIILYKVGTLKPAKIEECITKVIEVLRS